MPSTEEDRNRWKQYYRKHRKHKIAKVKEYQKTHAKTITERVQACERRNKAKVVELLGTKCFLCKIEGGQELEGIQMHEKNGNSHHRSYGYVLRHIESFVPLCSSCHQTVHNLMIRFAVSWEQIVDVLQSAFSRWGLLHNAKPKKHFLGREFA